MATSVGMARSLVPQTLEERQQGGVHTLWWPCALRRAGLQRVSTTQKELSAARRPDGFAGSFPDEAASQNRLLA